MNKLGQGTICLVVCAPACGTGDDAAGVDPASVDPASIAAQAQTADFSAPPPNAPAPPASCGDQNGGATVTNSFFEETAGRSRKRYRALLEGCKVPSRCFCE